MNDPEEFPDDPQMRFQVLLPWLINGEISAEDRCFCEEYMASCPKARELFLAEHAFAKLIKTSNPDDWHSTDDKNDEVGQSETPQPSNDNARLSKQHGDVKSVMTYPNGPFGGSRKVTWLMFGQMAAGVALLTILVNNASCSG